MSPRRRRLAFALVLTLVAFAGVLSHPGAVVGRPEGELRDHVWLSWVLAQELWAGHLPLGSALGGVPEGLRVYPLDPLHQLLIALGTPALGVVLALDLQAMLAYFALVYGGQKLADGRGWPAELTLGTLAGLSPAFLGAFADTQTEGMSAGWLLLFLGELFAPTPRPARAALWGAVLVATGPYLAHGVAVVAVVTWLLRRFPLKLAAPVVLWAGLLGVAMWTTESGRDGALGARASQMEKATRPPRSSPLGVQAPPPLPDTGVVRHLGDYPGAAETGPRRAAPWLLGGLVLLGLADRRARVPAALAAAYGLVALGNRWGAVQVANSTPYDVFWQVYPLARYAWKPAQYAVPATAFALMAAAGAFAPGAPWRTRLAPLVGVGAVVELLARSPTPLPLPASALVPRPVWSALGEGGAVVEYPCRHRSPPGVPPVSDALLGPLWHGRGVGETHRGSSQAHTELVDALDAVAFARREAPLDGLLRDAAGDGLTDVLVLGPLLGEVPATRLVRALQASGATVVPPSGDGLPAGEAWPDGVVHLRLPAP